MRILSVVEVILVVVLLLAVEVLAMNWLGLGGSEQIVPLDLLQVKLVQVPLVLFVIAGLLTRRHQTMATLGWGRPKNGWGKAIGTGVAFTLPLMLVSFAVAHVGNLLFPREVPLPFNLDSPWALSSFLLVAIIAGGIAEEIQFRGFIFQRFEHFFQGFGGPPQRAAIRATLLTSALFAILHIYEGPAAVMAIFVVSLGLQALYLRAGRNLVSCMVCHSLFNGVQIGLMFAVESV